jgi:hypothetical protein
MRDNKTSAADPAPPTANPGYAAGMLAKALTTSASHADAATRERALAKVERWKDPRSSRASSSAEARPAPRRSRVFEARRPSSSGGRTTRSSPRS